MLVSVIVVIVQKKVLKNVRYDESHRERDNKGKRAQSELYEYKVSVVSFFSLFSLLCQPAS